MERIRRHDGANVSVPGALNGADGLTFEGNRSSRSPNIRHIMGLACWIQFPALAQTVFQPRLISGAKRSLRTSAMSVCHIFVTGWALGIGPDRTGQNRTQSTEVIL